MKKEITFTLNGEKVSASIEVGMSLLECLREEFGLTGSKEGCGVGECGACTVIIDGETVDSCIYLAVWADGKDVRSIEGVTHSDGTLTKLQQSFIDAGAVQCGFCTPGLVVSGTALLEKHPHPTRMEIRRGMSGNLCRCTGYQKIIHAVETAAGDEK